MAQIPSVLLTPPDIAMLAKYARGKTRLAEIGVFMGASACVIRGVLNPEAFLYLIDPYYGAIVGITRYPASMHHALDAVNVNRVGHVIWMDMESQAAAQCFMGPTFDFLFIDGDHSYQGVKLDWTLFKPFLVKGAHVLFHDAAYPQGEPGCIKLTDEILGDPDMAYLEQQGLIRAFQRL